MPKTMTDVRRRGRELAERLGMFTSAEQRTIWEAAAELTGNGGPVDDVDRAILRLARNFYGRLPGDDFRSPEDRELDELADRVWGAKVANAERDEAAAVEADQAARDALNAAIAATGGTLMIAGRTASVRHAHGSAEQQRATVEAAEQQIRTSAAVSEARAILSGVRLGRTTYRRALAAARQHRGAKK